MKAVSNSGPLIHLAKISALWLLWNLFDEIVIPVEVKRDVVDIGLALGYDDAKIIERAISEGKIKVIKYTTKKLKFPGKFRIKKAEIIALLLAKQLNYIFLCDDDEARRLARKFGVQVKGSVGIIILAFKHGLITKDAAIKYLNKLKLVMYLSDDVFSYIMKTLKSD